MSARTRARLAWSLCGLTLALLAVSLLLYPRGTAAALPEDFSTWREQAILVLGVAGATRSRRPDLLPPPREPLRVAVARSRPGVRDEVLAVVRETVQPEHASLWLRPTGEGRQPVAEKRQP